MGRRPDFSEAMRAVEMRSRSRLYRARLATAGRTAHVRSRFAAEPLLSDAEEILALLRRAGGDLGIEIVELPGDFLRLSRAGRDFYAHDLDFPFEHLVPWFVCGDKELAASILAARGIPVLRSRSFRASGYPEALDYARRLGGPVVVKPTRNTTQSMGVSLNVTGDREFRSAFAKALAYGKDVLVEQQADGQLTRVTLLEGTPIGIVRRIPGHVTGDGRRSVRELVAAKNDGLRRHEPTNRMLRPLTLDTEARRLLEARGLSVESVPAAGELVYLRALTLTERGGELHDVHDCHPDLIDLARRAATALGPVLCAVDVFVQDLAAGADDGNMVINEVNTTPALNIASAYVDGAPSPAAARRVLEHLFGLTPG